MTGRIVVGGKVRTNILAMVDSDAIAIVEGLAVDTLFISCDAASPETGLTTPYRKNSCPVTKNPTTSLSGMPFNTWLTQYPWPVSSGWRLKTAM